MLKCAAIFLCLTFLAATSAMAQTGAAAAAGAGAALAGSAAQSGTSAANNAASAGGGASQTPVEVQIMVYGALKQIARHITDRTKVALITNAPETPPAILDGVENPWHCTTQANYSLLLQDSTSSAQIALYETFEAYNEALLHDYDALIGLIKIPKGKEDTKRDDQLKQLQEQIKSLQDKIEELQKQVKQHTSGNTKLNHEDIDKLSQVETETVQVESNTAAIKAATPASGTTGTGTGSGSGGGGSSSTPPSMQYLSGVGGEITAAKSNMSYTSSSVQALNQALTTELGKDLCQEGIQLRTATTTLNVAEGSADIAKKWNKLEKRSAQLSRLITWLQKPADKPADATKGDADADADAPNPKPIPTSGELIVTSDGIVLGSTLTGALTALQSWLSSGDQMGGIILTDIIKGDQLFKDSKVSKLPALQPQ